MDKKTVAAFIVRGLTLILLGAALAVVIVWRGENIAQLDKLQKELISQVLSPRYEYKVLSVLGEGSERTGLEAMKFATVTPSESDLNKLGNEGWELVSSYLEVETAFPNFGDSEYVTGLRSNVRPQRAVLLLRRRIVSP